MFKIKDVSTDRECVAEDMDTVRAYAKSVLNEAHEQKFGRILTFWDDERTLVVTEIEKVALRSFALEVGGLRIILMHFSIDGARARVDEMVGSPLSWSNVGDIWYGDSGKAIYTLVDREYEN